MNVNDFDDIQIPEGDMLEIIFNHQRDLMDKYHAIEEQNLGHKVPADAYVTNLCKDPQCWGECGYPATIKTWLYAGALDINDRHSQLRMKDFAWRITEEITEATEALEQGHRIHFIEELIDALHFSVELCCLCGVGPSDLCSKIEGDSLDLLFKLHQEANDCLEQYRAYEAIESLGKAMNMLKLKPWKTTAMMTDVARFKHQVVDFFNRLIILLVTADLDAPSTCLMYLKKHAVNQFRQRSAY